MNTKQALPERFCLGADLLFVAYMDVGKGREQDAQALLGFYLVH